MPSSDTRFFRHLTLRRTYPSASLQSRSNELEAEIDASRYLWCVIKEPDAGSAVFVVALVRLDTMQAPNFSHYLILIHACTMSFDVERLCLYFLVAVISFALYLTAFPGSREEPNNTTSTPLRKPIHATPHRHSCQYCRSITIKLRSEPSSTQYDLLVRLDLTSSQVAEVAARDCPLLRDAHSIITAPLSVRIWCHLQTFFDIFSTESDLHAFTGCDNFLERACYFIRGLSSRPFHIRLSHLPSESGGTLYARLLYTAARLFDFDVSSDQGDSYMDCVSCSFTHVLQTIMLLNISSNGR